MDFVAAFLSGECIQLKAIHGGISSLPSFKNFGFLKAWSPNIGLKKDPSGRLCALDITYLGLFGLRDTRLIDRPRLWSQLCWAINSIIQLLWVPSRCIHQAHESLQASKLTDFINFLQPENPAVIDSVEKSEELQVLSKTVLSDSPDYTEPVGKDWLSSHPSPWYCS